MQFGMYIPFWEGRYRCYQYHSHDSTSSKTSSESILSVELGGQNVLPVVILEFWEAIILRVSENLAIYNFLEFIRKRFWYWIIENDDFFKDAWSVTE